jgi:hypothetical protein
VTNYGRELPPGGRDRQAEESPSPRELPGGARDVGGDDIGRVAVQAAAGPVNRIVVRGSACDAASWTSRSGTPASSAAVMNACLSCGE